MPVVAVPAPRLDQAAPLDPVRDRFRGAIVGLAVGDALGATVEFERRGTFRPPTDLVGGGPFKLKPGEWTDDTSQALCLATSLIECGGFDPQDCMTRLHRWMTKGYLSVNGRCFDIGTSTSASLRAFGSTGDPYQGRADRDTNGALMRLAPVPLARAGDTVEALRVTDLSTRLTHGGSDARSASRYLAALLLGAVGGASHDDLVGVGRVHVPPGFDRRDWTRTLSEDVVRAATGSSGGAVRAGFTAVECLNASLWAVRYATDFESAVCRAAGLGDDSDTAGAVAGQVAGAIWGYHAIPARWKESVAWHLRLVEIADGLYAMSGLLKTSAPANPEAAAVV